MRCRSMGARGWRERPSKHGRRLASHRSRRLGCRSHAGSANCANGCLGNACRRFQQRSREDSPNPIVENIAFTDLGTTLDGHPDFPTGLSYLKKLGITAVQLMPIYDFGSVDETICSRYNWGYDPVNYNVPEGSYSTNPYDGPCASARSSRWCRRCIMPASK